MTQMAVLETRARSEVPAVVERRPETAGPDNRFRRKRPARCHGPAARALEERRPRHSFVSISNTVVPVTPQWEKARRNRRAPGASSGGKRGCDERSREEQTGCPPGAAIVRSPTVPPSISGTAASCQRQPLRVFVSSCLRCLTLCFSLCLCASVVHQVGGRAWRSWRLGGFLLLPPARECVEIHKL